ncbi:MAG: Rrf2 family transcriptional regulator [Bdellovibrionales bacterium]|nr:Rrf2 family transcriptional regulator [Bdellovibrionales bacterium]
MRLTDHTDYAMRTLMYLNREKRLVTLSELSKALGISRNNLIKVSHQLAKTNLIETTRGRSGGLAIGPGKGKTSLKEIVTLTEESFTMAECFSRKAKSTCTFLPSCVLKHALADALNAFLESLGRKTLDDVTPRK